MEMLLAGDWVDRSEKIEVQDPFDGTTIDTVPSAGAGDVESALAASVEG
jgi:acyl-CoA reductase-like NAD-dependent aldehyde dehydrogenase